jgi:hypothetical protein
MGPCSLLGIRSIFMGQNGFAKQDSFRIARALVDSK